MQQNFLVVVKWRDRLHLSELIPQGLERRPDVPEARPTQEETPRGGNFPAMGVEEGASGGLGRVNAERELLRPKHATRDY